MAVTEIYCGPSIWTFFCDCVYSRLRKVFARHEGFSACYSKQSSDVFIKETRKKRLNHELKILCLFATTLLTICFNHFSEINEYTHVLIKISVVLSVRGSKRRKHARTGCTIRRIPDGRYHQVCKYAHLIAPHPFACFFTFVDVEHCALLPPYSPNRLSCLLNPFGLIKCCPHSMS